MKFLYEQGNEQMDLERAEDYTEGQSRFIFHCPAGNNGISMINNPPEMKLVRSPGINV
jgi:hypothetical protein